MEKIRRVRFDVFNYYVYLVYTDNISKSRDNLRDQLGRCKPLESTVDGLHSYFGGDFEAYIFFTPDSTQGTISHECYHAVSRMFRFFGAKHEEELTAYHLGYLVDEAASLKVSEGKPKKKKMVKYGGED